MRILFIGDASANTGPSNVNKLLIRELPSNTIFLKSRWMIFKLIKMFLCVPFVDAIVMSGLSKLNIFTLIWSKLWRRKTVYIMHGCVEYENFLNHVNDEDTVKLERRNLSSVVKILCVSEPFSIWLKQNYPQYSKKTSFLTNGIDWSLHKKYLSEKSGPARRKGNILTIGGGMPGKNILKVCEAIELAKKQDNLDIELTVLGCDAEDTAKIKKYPFVHYLGVLKQEDVINYYRQAELFIQNSVFETFGLAPLEALMCGCSILVSKNVGSLSVMNNLTKYDVIEDCFDIVEIKKKILYLLENPNNKRIIESIDRNRTSYASAAINLIDIISSMNE